MIRFLGSIAWVVLLVAASACSSGKPYRIELMPSPAVYSSGILDPFAGSGPADPGYELLFATDREPAGDEDKEPYYTSARGHALRLGAAAVELVADPPLDWEQAKRTSLAADRGAKFPLQVSGCEEYGVLDAGIPVLAGIEGDPEAGRKFARRIDGHLAQATVKDIFIYVHGYKVVFEDPVLVAAELWHFLGYEGVFVAYSWPATPSVWAYASDIETAAYTARNLRILIEYLSKHTKARRIHVLGYSAGTRVVFGALAQLALLHSGKSAEEIRQRVRLGHVILTAGDVDRDMVAAFIEDGLLEVSDALTIYQSGSDAALGLSKWLFSRQRVGQVGNEEQFGESARDLVRSRKDLIVINASDAADAGSGNGHGYFRNSPWVSSDILLTLRFDLSPARRGLVREEAHFSWEFPPDYLDRLRSLARSSSSPGAKQPAR